MSLNDENRRVRVNDEMFSQFETLREGSDYTGFYRVTPEALKQKVPLAKEMIDSIAEMVK